MAVVDKNTTEWLNPDGLLQKFGTDRAREERGGEYSRLSDGQHMVSFMLDLAGLPTVASGNEQIQMDYVTIPNGAFITKVRVTVIEEPTDASGTANLDMGLVDQDRSTEIDFNGLLAAADLFNAGTDLGTIVEYDTLTTESGALMGTQITNTGLITASAETADFTDGTLKVDIEYYVPLSADL
jgi:hypothetical protein